MRGKTDIRTFSQFPCPLQRRVPYYAFHCYVHSVCFSPLNGVRCSAFDARRSMLSVRCSAFDARRSVLGVRTRLGAFLVRYLFNMINYPPAKIYIF